MARGKGKTIPIKLLSSAGTGFFYTTRKNVVRTPEKIALVKYDVCCLTNIKLNEREARDVERAIEWRKDDVSVHSLRRRIIWLWYPQDLCSLPGFIKDSIKIKVTEEAVTLSFHSWRVRVTVYP
jgi:large subunit ribosomal protein L33